MLKSQNVEIFLHFTDISDMREESLHIIDIEANCGKMESGHLPFKRSLIIACTRAIFNDWEFNWRFDYKLLY